MRARRTGLLAGALFVALVAVFPVQAQKSAYYVAADDPMMAAAEKRAVSELDDFFALLALPRSGESAFKIKFDLSRGGADGDVEFIWAEVVRHVGTQTEAVLANDPIHPGFVRGQKVVVEDRWIDDWSYWQDDVLHGAYTIRVLLDRMPAKDAAVLRHGYGW
ncbi:DUF2314 domain-containing protein [Sphingosinithalassobacter portus]|uniref:DUF2314 domain-containing protein n=1 Tax=Stakelama portus TaxID=2676234 RepID=UPI000D6E12E4|nr:DUF2314 domain-containing protein [Sphingosinithalassobacter portus]